MHTHNANSFVDALACFWILLMLLLRSIWLRIWNEATVLPGAPLCKQLFLVIVAKMIYDSRFLIYCAYASSMSLVLSLVSSMACDDGDGCVMMFTEARILAPYLLGSQPTKIVVAARIAMFVATVEGVTFTLYNKLSTNCLHCGSEELGVAPGWAYVSSCGNICFHVSCLMDFILDECKNSSNTEQAGPSQTVETQSVADANRGQQVVILREKKNSSIGKVVPVLNAILLRDINLSNWSSIKFKTRMKDCLYKFPGGVTGHIAIYHSSSFSDSISSKKKVFLKDIVSRAFFSWNIARVKTL
ncbi:hypothetical protein Tco_0797607 [Tanacetum coccineum]